MATDSTNSFTVNCYEFSGSPIREVIHTWVNGTVDLLTGLTHYNGVDSGIGRLQSNQTAEFVYNGVDSGIGRLQSNQTAEFVYVSTDHTGEEVEYACLLANCFPANVKIS